MVLSIFREGRTRIVGALAVGAVLIGGVLLLEHRTEVTTQAPVAAVALSGERTRDVRATQPTLDTDGDGYPDWEEELRGTDPFTPTTLETASTTPDGDVEPYEPPTTLTGRFAEEFLKGLIEESAGRDLTDEEKVAFAANAASELAKAVPDKLYTRADLHIVSDNTQAAHRTYGNTVSSVLIEHNVESDQELEILELALSSNDASVLEQLTPVANAYAAMVRDLVAHPVPAALTKEHLDLINTLSIIETDIRAMQATFDDPLQSLLRIRRYQEDAAGLFYALDNLRIALEKSGVAYTSSESGIVLFSLRP